MPVFLSLNQLKMMKTYVIFSDDDVSPTDVILWEQNRNILDDCNSNVRVIIVGVFIQSFYLMEILLDNFLENCAEGQHYIIINN